ncbi:MULTISPECIES: hypothetical protein [unclassified Streptomyces]|uniref:hypothetical protein n=1 Tax=unclassified Streptomyces TaxID=2593676 RepID=UPI002E3218E2|nr:hypothetical protein [Streptomyces sp. NBC_01268]
MQAQLREKAAELAAVLWKEHTVYRERGGGVVIRGEHVRRWISLAPTGGKDQALVRAGRILDGGTTAPARLEAVVDLSAGTSELAAVCRRLLAETAADSGVPHRPVRAARAPRPRGGRHTGLGSWIALLCVAGVVAFWAYSVFGSLY